MLDQLPDRSAELKSMLYKNYSDYSLVLTAYARNGIYLSANYLQQISPIRRIVLVPAYSCGDEIAAYVTAGLEVLPYSVSNDFQTDIQGLKKTCAGRKDIIAIHHTNFFGITKDASAVKDLCNEFGLIMLEDLAHTVPSKLNLTGDFCFASLRKHLPVPEGGILFCKDIEAAKFLESRQIPFPDDLHDITAFMYLGQKFDMFAYGTRIEQIHKRLGVNQSSGLHGARFEQRGGYRLKLSRLTQNLLVNVDFDKILTQRKGRYQKVVSKIHQDVLSDISNPYGVFLKVRNSAEFHKWLLSIGLRIGNPFWDDLHKYIDWKMFPEAKEMKNRVYIIRLDRDLSKVELDLLAYNL